MTRAWLAGIALLAALPARAEDVAGLVSASVGFSSREFVDDKPWDQLTPRYENGRAYGLSGTVRGRPGWLARGQYVYTEYDTFEIMDFVISEGIRHQEAQLGLFYAPVLGDVFGFRLGGGYQHQRKESIRQEGGFAEAGLSVIAARWLGFDVAAAYSPMHGTGEHATKQDRTEASVEAIVHSGPLEAGFAYRYVVDSIEEWSDTFGNISHDEKDQGARLRIGMTWGRSR